MSPGLSDEYQDPVSPGSLVKARHCWIDLSTSQLRSLPHRFTFTFQSPNQRMALGLMEFLRYAHYGGFVRTIVRARGFQRDPWHVAGTTPAKVWNLSSLEHLFMHLRGAGSRYESALVNLDLLWKWPRAVPTRAASSHDTCADPSI